MTRRPQVSHRGFTLVEVLISMSLAMIVMAAVFSTYLYLGRNLTRLSYRTVMESQSRKILTTLTTDIRKTKSILSASSTDLSLAMIDGSTVTYLYNASKLTRDPDGPGIASPVLLNYDIKPTILPVAMPIFSFQYYTTSGGDPMPTLMSIKQVAINFTLQAGTAAIEGQQGTFSEYPVASGKMPLINRQLPDGT